MATENYENQSGLDLTAIREKLAGKTGQAYWRGLEEVAETPEFQKWMGDEFPDRATLLQLDRRSFLKFMGASMALAGVAGCRYMPQEKIVPYVKQPEDLVYNNPMLYATAMPFRGYGLGVLATSREGRPIKVDGNPDHPSIVGTKVSGPVNAGSNVWLQASLLDLYDPDRLQNTQKNGDIASFDELLATARPLVTKVGPPAPDSVGAPVPAETAPVGGGQVRILTETVTSPTLADQLKRITAKYPHVKWHQYQPVSGNNGRLGAKMAIGRFLNPVYDFTKASVILSLDGDFFTDLPGSIRYAREYADRRRVSKGANSTIQNRLYAVESTPTLAGANADHRLPMRASDVELFARALFTTLETASASAAPAEPPKGSEKFLKAVADDLKAAGAGGLVIAGEHQPPVVHALAHTINKFLGAVGGTVKYTESVEAEPVDQIASIKQLVADMDSGQVSMIIIVGGNPVYDAPVDLAFEKVLPKVPTRICMAHSNNETAAVCNWVVPESHYLEAWGDLRGHDGTVSIIQPLIHPLYESRSAIEFFASVFEEPRAGLELVQGYWKQTKPSADFAKQWERWLNDGVIPDTAAAPANTIAEIASALPAPPTPAPESEVQVIFRPDPSLWDGRYANNPWLQELPKALTKLTWDNAALVGFSMAERNHWSTGDLIRITHNGRKLDAPVWVMPGHVDNAVTLYLGGGREVVGVLGQDSGFNAYRLITSGEPNFGVAQIERAPGGYHLVTTQTQNTLEGRDVIRSTTMVEWSHGKFGGPEGEEKKAAGESAPAAAADGTEANNERVQQGTVGPPEDPNSMYNLTNEYEKTSGVSQWGMTIDMTACIGCNACAVACQAENNIPSVGKDQVAKGRHMNWMRIDRYYATNDKKGITADNPDVLFQPMLCMHCEKAPCEPVCPVGATMHSHEGLNQMVYNRCVGTRYCSNNCPYKVRRFNFLNFANHHDTNAFGQNAIPLKLANNPDVTVRGRGVMEKCTYCVQRINRARITSKRDNTTIADGDVVTACQQACPTHAITFGDLTDAKSEVNQWKKEPHNYLLLEELNTTPRTSYLARVRNPNPALETE